MYSNERISEQTDLNLTLSALSKRPPPTIQLSKFKFPKKRRGVYSVNYLQGLWRKLLKDSYNKIVALALVGLRKRPILKGRFSFKLRWEHVIIAFLLGALLLQGGSGRIVRSVQPISPAPAILSIKPLPKLKEASYAPQTPVEPVWVSKLRPPDTYPNGYAPGNCTYGVASRLPIPNDWGNANNWAYAAAIQGYTITNTPAPEEIAQTGGDSYLGHVAVVISLNPDGSFVVWEENYNGLFSTDIRTTTTAEFPNFIKV